MSTNNHLSANHGFTLVEMLIIAPMVILVIGGFIALMVTMVGDVLTTRDHNALVYDTQDALTRIEQDARSSTQFLATTGTLPSPQGYLDAATPFTSDNALILNEFATDKNPTDSTRKLVYYEDQPLACGAQESQNAILHVKVIYYIKGTSLWRRTVVPAYNTNPSNQVCDTPWQQNTCSPGHSAALCDTNDSEIMQNITNGSVKYYATSGGTVDLGAAGALNAAAIEVTIVSSKNIAGRTISNTATLRATKLNSD